MTFTQHAKVIRIEVSVGSDDAERTIEQFEHDVQAALQAANPHNVTVQGSYYIIDGHVCTPVDYNPRTHNRKPGTHPPPWAGGPPAAAKRAATVYEDSDTPREFVRITPTRSNERHPLTGRRIRKDKGSKRGPRTAAADTDTAASVDSAVRN